METENKPTYTVIQERDIDTLSVRVTEMKKGGWVTAGGVALAIYSGQTYYSQAMEKSSPENVSYPQIEINYDEYKRV